MRDRLAGSRVMLAASALLLTLPVAHAQWKWRDETGQIHYSDRPPPKTVPAPQILRSAQPPAPPAGANAGSSATGAPGQASSASTQAGARHPQAVATPASQAVAAPGNGVTGRPDPTPAGSQAADLSLQLKRRQQEREAAERKQQEEVQKAAARAQACDALRADLRLLESGIRVVGVDKQGEQEFLSDEERASRIDRLRKEEKSYCVTS